MNFSVFFRLLDSADKGADLARAIEAIGGANSTTAAHFVEPSLFRAVPGSPFAYWVSDAVRDCFKTLPRFESDGRTVKQGMATGFDFRFVRAAWEVPHGEKLNASSANWKNADAFQAWCVGQSKAGVRWFTFAKGGDYLPFYADVSLVGNWLNDGAEIRNFFDPKTGKLSSRPQSMGYYFRAGYTYPLRTSRLCPQVMPAGTLISVRGSGIFGDTTGKFLAVLGSRPFDYLIKMMLGWASRPQFDMGDINATPVPDIGPTDGAELAALAMRCVASKRGLDATMEETNVFICLGLGHIAESLAAGVAEWASRIQVSTTEVSGWQSQIDDIAFRLYGINDDDRKAMEADAFTDDDGEPAEANEAETSDINTADGFVFASRNISYAVGAAFGRWDIRYATGERPAPDLPDPFAPLPVCPPGMLKGDDGLPLSSEVGRQLRAQGGYPLDVVWDGILVEDPEHPFDLERRVQAALAVLWADRIAEIKQEACTLLGVPSLREWFRRPAGFFADHLKRYSKSRRQAPIYWPLSAGSGNYSVWLYYHRFNADTLYRVLRDFVEPRLQQVEREQFELESQGALSGDAAVRLQEAQTLLQDLRVFKSELDLVAPLWNPNLNDGVIINHAILWRITPYTPWQKKCKECWDKLVKGDYDWAHLALHLWPERVIPKCTTDRSLAIAHGLEERLWQETNNGNWLPRQLSETDLQAVIAEHSNPAVKNALERFLAAPPPVSPTRTRASRSTRASGSSAPQRPRGTAAVVDAEATRQVLLALTAAPSDGLAKAAIADLIGVEANALTAVIKQLKESGQIDQLGERRGARYVLSEQGRAAVASETEGEA